MSLRSGKDYLKNYELQNEADTMQRPDEDGEQPPHATDQLPSTPPSPPLDNRSKATSRRSHTTSSGSSATKAYAKAQAAKAQLAFAEKEANMMKQKAELEASMLKQKADVEKQKADLDASLHVLKCQKEVAAAEAEAAAYEEVENQSGERSIGRLSDAEPLDTVQRTREYVAHQCESVFSEASDTSHRPFEMKDNAVEVQATNQSVGQLTNATQYMPPPMNTGIKQEQKVIKGPTNTHFLNPLAHTFQPPNNTSAEFNGAQDFAKYLIRKELVSAGLLHFDDKPENYWAWKASFVSATKDLNLSVREELDLLAKWLGPKSSEQAKRIRAAHTLNPSAGVKLIWQRLEECYGSSEAIEDALLKKVEDFPRLTNKDNARLRDLGDLLLELQCSKADGALPGLAYLDTARGVRQIVEKLPFNLQERWTTVGTQYKDSHGVSFPPFSVFLQFVQQQAKMKNDPSFATSNCNSQAPSRSERPTLYNRKATVSVHKTEIAEKSGSETKKIEEPDRQCPIHKKPHPLKKCKTFRDKPIEERQAFLKEHRICYRCCGSVQHMAKDCKAAVKCIECNSPKHISALHPGPTPAPKSAPSESDEQNKGEEQTESSPSVISKCTEVCGQSNNPRSCSKICLVKAYPEGRKDRAINTYAVIDEQSNRSLARTEFFNLFEIKATPAPYTLKTCSGKAQTTGRRAVNFFIQSMDGKTDIRLPPLIEG